MYLESLSMCDFRVFQGKHTIDLSPRIKWNKRQPIVLFGGLNGAGKTSILTAIRLALYGRQSLGAGTSQKAYDEFLSKSIHNARGSTLKTNYASVELEFTYSNMGVKSRYKIIRDWNRAGKKIKESLALEKDGVKEKLNYEQAQSFLNELIPIGVSELFFFDGEKIAELAEDSKGSALADAIKKLLGLDLIDRLKLDLSIIARNQNKQSSTRKDRAEIEKLEVELEKVEKKAEAEINEYQTCRNSWTEANARYERLTNELNDRGGAWAATREEEIAKSTELKVKKESLGVAIKEELAKSFPLGLAPKLVKKTLKQLDAENEIKTYQIKKDSISDYSKSLLSDIKKSKGQIDVEAFKDICNKTLTKFTGKMPKGKIIHDLSNSDYQRNSRILEDALDKTSSPIVGLRKQLSEINDELDNLGRNIARAPDESTLVHMFDDIKVCQETLNQTHAKMLMHKETAKKILRESVSIAKKLNHLHRQIISLEEKEHANLNLDSSIEFLSDFGKHTAEQKIKELEIAFAKTFKRLARKDDVNISATIDNKTFKVTLINEYGQVVNRDELSAGEKQIYAISILEALARTSGRNLPIIIDTPLGRLDSKHRRNLVEYYFPSASQQVVILSTDEEVDEEFYRDLNKHMSHAFMLEYNSAQGCSFANEGYFWKSMEAA